MVLQLRGNGEHVGIGGAHNIHMPADIIGALDATRAGAGILEHVIHVVTGRRTALCEVDRGSAEAGAARGGVNVPVCSSAVD